MTDELAEALLNCPFCGHSKPEVRSIRDGLQVVCTDCFSRGEPVYQGPGGWNECRAEAIAAWNRRPAVAALMGDGAKQAIKNKIDLHLDSYLCEMKEGFDDSVSGFNEAWDVVRKVFAETTPTSDPVEDRRVVIAERAKYLAIIDMLGEHQTGPIKPTGDNEDEAACDVGWFLALPGPARAALGRLLGGGK